MKARTVGRDQGVGDGVGGRLSQIASVSTTGHRLVLALKWEAVAGCSPMLDRLSAYHGPPSNTVVVSGAFLGEVIFKMMMEGFTSKFDDHMLYLTGNQRINSTVEGMNID